MKHIYSYILELEADINKGRTAWTQLSEHERLAVRKFADGRYSYEYERDETRDYCNRGNGFFADPHERFTSLDEFLTTVAWSQAEKTNPELASKMRGALKEPIWSLSKPGKRLVDLIDEVDTLHCDLVTVLHDHASFTWQRDGTLCYFDSDDGYPGFYWRADDEGDDIDIRENFTSLARMLALMKNYLHGDDPYVNYLFTAPVWLAVPAHDEEEFKAFNDLLGDLEIDL